MAIIQLEVGLFSLRLGHGAALTCPRRVIHSRASASLPLKLPRCAVIFPQQHRFFDSLSLPQGRLFLYHGAENYALAVGAFGAYAAAVSLRNGARY